MSVLDPHSVYAYGRMNLRKSFMFEQHEADNGSWGKVKFGESILLQTHWSRTLARNSHFTISWPGKFDRKLLHRFLDTAFSYDKDMLGVLFFFEKEQFYSFPKKIDSIPSREETELTQDFGEPGLIRYEIFSESVYERYHLYLSPDSDELGFGNIDVSRFVLWGSAENTSGEPKAEFEDASSSNTGEIGLYLTPDGFDAMKKEVVPLIGETMAAIPDMSTNDRGRINQSMVEEIYLFVQKVLQKTLVDSEA